MLAFWESWDYLTLNDPSSRYTPAGVPEECGRRVECQYRFRDPKRRLRMQGTLVYVCCGVQTLFLTVNSHENKVIYFGVVTIQRNLTLAFLSEMQGTQEYSAEARFTEGCSI